MCPKRTITAILAEVTSDPNRKSGSAASDEMPRLKTRSTIGLHFSYHRPILWVCEDAFLRREDTVRTWQLALLLRGIRV